MTITTTEAKLSSFHSPPRYPIAEILTRGGGDLSTGDRGMPSITSSACRANVVPSKTNCFMNTVCMPYTRTRDRYIHTCAPSYHSQVLELIVDTHITTVTVVMSFKRIKLITSGPPAVGLRYVNNKFILSLRRFGILPSFLAHYIYIRQIVFSLQRQPHL